MQRLITRFLFVLGLMVSAWTSSAMAEESHAGDAAIRGVITSQLEAFAADRDAEAYSYAAPLIKLAFPTVDSFMAMVKKGYQPVYRNSGYRFGQAGVNAVGLPTQSVILQGTDGKTYEAFYTLEQQPDGTWKIVGCMIKALPGTSV